MTTTVLSAALQGVTAVPVEVEVDLLRRLPAVCIVGLPASAVKESAERVRSAIEASGFEFPRTRVMITLTPADIRKDGTAFDLPLALGVLAAGGHIPADAIASVLAVGELSLDGRLRPIRGALSLAMAARELGRVLIVPEENGLQAALVPDAKVWSARTLAEVVRWLCGKEDPRFARPPLLRPPTAAPDMADVRGHARTKRALEVAAAGGHHILLVGPPGCGKSMLAQRLPSILPPLTFEESLECTQMYCAAGLLHGDSTVSHPPFRAPHHTVTVAGLVGGSALRPGEVTLAHHGVLLFDDAAEFSRSALEVLRQPLEDGVIRITRGRDTVVWPAAVTLVLASNPCPCGNLGSTRPCGCSDRMVHDYQRRLSGPIFDRVDLHVELRAVPADELLDGPRGEASATIRERVIAARARQWARGQRVPNARLDVSSLQRVARTIADLAGSAIVTAVHEEEAALFCGSGTENTSYTVRSTSYGSPPDLDSLLGSAGSPSHLLVRLRELERRSVEPGTPDAFWGVATVGGVLRLWRPVTVAETLEAVRSGTLPAPVQRAQAWARTLGGGEREAISLRIWVATNGLRDAVDAFADEPTDDGAAAVADLRDALECARAVLEVVGHDERADAALCFLDNHALSRGIVPSQRALSLLPWLGNVAAARPHAWWAAS